MPTAVVNEHAVDLIVHASLRSKFRASTCFLLEAGSLIPSDPDHQPHETPKIPQRHQDGQNCHGCSIVVIGRRKEWGGAGAWGRQSFHSVGNGNLKLSTTSTIGRWWRWQEHGLGNEHTMAGWLGDWTAAPFVNKDLAFGYCLIGFASPAAIRIEVKKQTGCKKFSSLMYHGQLDRANSSVHRAAYCLHSLTSPSHCMLVLNAVP